MQVAGRPRLVGPGGERQVELVGGEGHAVEAVDASAVEAARGHDLGDGRGLAVRGRWWWEGRAALWLKRRKDRRWLARYS